MKSGRRDIGKVVRYLPDKKSKFRLAAQLSRQKSVRASPDNVVRVLQISSKSVHFRRSYIRTREHHNLRGGMSTPVRHFHPVGAGWGVSSENCKFYEISEYKRRTWAYPITCAILTKFSDFVGHFMVYPYFICLNSLKGSTIMGFNLGGCVFPEFSAAYGGEIIRWIRKKFLRCKNGTDLPILSCRVRGGVGIRAPSGSG